MAKIRRSREPSRSRMERADGVEIVAGPGYVAVAITWAGKLVGVPFTAEEARQFARELDSAAARVEVGDRAH